MDLRPGEREFQQRAQDVGPDGFVLMGISRMEDGETPISLYRKLLPLGAHYLLESAGESDGPGRYSIIGLEPREHLIFEKESSPFEGLEAILRRYRVSIPEGFPPFVGGAVGYITFEAARYIEGDLLFAPSPWPDGEFSIAGTYAILDHFTHTLHLLTLAPATAEGYARGKARLLEVQQAIREGDGFLPEVPLPEEEPPSGSSFPRAAFLAAVRRAQEAMARGEVLQVVLAQKLRRGLLGHPFDIYRALRSLNPSPYLFYLDFGPRILAGSSPETLLKVEGRRLIHRPIAGTRPRGETKADDEALLEELLKDPKEASEHAMLVDLGRDDLSRVCRPGTVRIVEERAVEKYSRVMHLVTELQGELAEGLSPLQALKSVFPAGTLTGAPRRKALEAILSLEPEARGPYGGVVGYVGFNGQMDMAIAIRMVALREGRAEIGAGAGVVQGSVPEREYQETMDKARAVEEALQMARILSPVGGVRR